MSTIETGFTRGAFRHTHTITHVLQDGSLYEDSFLCTPPEGTSDVLAWGVAEVKRRRPFGIWTVTISSMVTGESLTNYVAPVAVPRGPAPELLEEVATAIAATPVNTNAVKPVAKGAKITVWEIKAKDKTSKGKTYPGPVSTGHHAEIVPGVSIRLFGLTAAGTKWVKKADGTMGWSEEQVYRRDFKIGDVANLGGRNMDFMGTITAIGPATVTISEGSSSRRLELYDFDRNNYDFDQAKSEKRNAQWND